MPNYYIIGGGRMGISHAALINGLLKQNVATIIEPSFLTRFLLKNMGFRVCVNMPKNFESDDKIFICTPTMSHFTVFKSVLERNAKNIFIEKPFMANSEEGAEALKYAKKFNAHVSVGYVYKCMKPVQDWRSLLGGESGCDYKLSLRSNVMSSPSTSWRARREMGGGVISEFGGHILSICDTVFGDIISSNLISADIVNSIDVEDVVQFKLEHNLCTGYITMDWTDKSTRKTMIDLQIGDTKQTLSSSGHNVEYYLRGEEFSDQMSNFLKLKNTINLTCANRAYQYDQITEKLIGAIQWK